jgi:tetratricopeptide (TPR) repeat protein
MVADRLAELGGADGVDDTALAGALQDGLRLTRAGRGGDELPPTAELADDLCDVYERLGRPDDAIAAMREAIAAGWNGVPDGRCRIAEILTAAGRIEEATSMWEQMAAEYPDDVWVFNNAGIEYAHAGHHETGLAYLTRGLELALDQGDPEQLVGQLADFRSGSLTKLDRQPDALQHRADQFLTAPPAPPTPTARQSAAVATRPTSPEMAGMPAAGQRQPAMAFAWFPADVWSEAAARWPVLPGSWGTHDYATYCAGLEAWMAEFAATTGAAPRLAPVNIDAYLAWCGHTGADPADAGSRANYAAHLDRAGKTLAWPPGRNRPCWCGSGRKYKHCCKAAAHNK